MLIASGLTVASTMKRYWQRQHCCWPSTTFTDSGNKDISRAKGRTIDGRCHRPRAELRERDSEERRHLRCIMHWLSWPTTFHLGILATARTSKNHQRTLLSSASRTASISVEDLHCTEMELRQQFEDGSDLRFLFSLRGCTNLDRGFPETAIFCDIVILGVV